MSGQLKRQERDVLLATLYAADMGTVQTLALNNSFLAEPHGQPKPPHVYGEHLSHIHPMMGVRPWPVLLTP